MRPAARDKEFLIYLADNGPVVKNGSGVRFFDSFGQGFVLLQAAPSLTPCKSVLSYQFPDLFYLALFSAFS